MKPKKKKKENLIENTHGDVCGFTEAFQSMDA
jgi:hypothetical protein